MRFNFDFPDLEKELDVNHLVNQTKIEQKYSRDLSRWINLNDQMIQANSFNDIIKIIKKGMQGQAGRQGINFIDLKEAFAQSPKAKPKKNGGWYLIIPLGQKSAQLKSAAPRSLWNQISGMDFGDTGQLSDGDSNFLQEANGGQTDTINPLDYTWKSSNVTRVAPKSGNGRYGHYIAFRTVSDTSDPNSWIVGKNAFTDKNTTPQQQTDIGVYIRHAIDQYQERNES